MEKDKIFLCWQVPKEFVSMFPFSSMGIDKGDVYEQTMTTNMIIK